MTPPCLAPRARPAHWLTAALLALGAGLSSGEVLAQASSTSAPAILESLSADATAAAGAGFTFALSAPATTSAGIYRDGVLIKTLWNNRRLGLGRHAASWDGTTDEDGVAPNGRYTLSVLANDVSYTWDGVIGNTSRSFTGPTKYAAMDIIHGMAVSGAKIFAAIGYNEARASSFRFDAADPTSRTVVLPTTFRITRAIKTLVATDDVNVYWAALDQFEPSRSFIAVTRVADDTEVELPAGQVLRLRPARNGASYKSAIDYVDRKSSEVTGLAVQKAGRFLLVARGALGRLHVLDKSSGALVKSIDLPAPGHLAADASNGLWIVLSEQGKPVVSRFHLQADGTLSSTASVTISDVQQPHGLALSPDGTTLLVADGGRSQQIKAFDTANGRARWTLGRPGGYASGPEVAYDKFMFHNPIPITAHGGRDWSFIAYEPDGSFWVGDSGNYRALRFRPDRTFDTKIMWMPLSYSVTVDPNDPRRVFGDFLEFEIDYAKPLGPANGSWKLVRNWGHNHPREFNDHYSRVRNVATLANGRTYSQIRSLQRNIYELVELVPGHGMRRTGLTTRNLEDVLHPDGSLRSEVGSLGPAARPGAARTWTRRSLAGFDASGNPSWGPPVTIATLTDFGPQDPLSFVSTLPGPWTATDSGLLVMFNPRHPRPGFDKDVVSHDGWHLGAVDPATGRWRWKAAPSTPRNYWGDWPDDGSYDIGNGVVVGGTQAHVIGSHILWHYRGEGWKGGRSGQTNKWTHVHQSGLLVGQFGVTGQVVRGAEVEGQYGMAGNGGSSRVVRGPDGALYVYHNDESYHGGIHRWRIANLASIVERQAPIEWDSARYRPRTDPSDLLEGLPRSASLASGDGGWRRMPEVNVDKDRVRQWFHVITGVKQYRKDRAADIEVSHVGVPSASVWRELPALPAASRGWVLTPTIGWTWENHGEDNERGSGGTYVEVLDKAEKIIARVWPKRVRHPDDFRLLANGTAIANAKDQISFHELIEGIKPLEIRATDGRISFRYDGGAAVTAAVVDPSADWRNPKIFRIRAWSNNAPAYRRTVHLAALRFAPAP